MTVFAAMRRFSANGLFGVCEWELWDLEEGGGGVFEAMLLDLNTVHS